MVTQSQQPYLPVPAGDIGLLTDFYELTMAQSYFAEGMDGEATFSLFVREYPPWSWLLGRRRRGRRARLPGRSVVQ